MDDPIETLATIEPHDRIQLVLKNGDRFEGAANPVVFTPEEHLRIEIKADDEDSTRYDVTSDYVDGEWEFPSVRRYKADVEEDAWVSVGQLGDVSVVDRFQRDDERSNSRI